MGKDFDETDPLYRQLIGEDELIEPLRTGKNKGKRENKHRNHGGPNPSFNGGPECPPCDFAPESPESSHEESLTMNKFFSFILSTRDPWRVVMGFTVLFLLLDMGASRGWVSVPGLSAYASADSVIEVRVEQLDAQIEVTVKADCLASTQESKEYYYRKIKDLKEKYRRASRAQYEPPTCKDLGVREVRVGEP